HAVDESARVGIDGMNRYPYLDVERDDRGRHRHPHLSRTRPTDFVWWRDVTGHILKPDARAIADHRIGSGVPAQSGRSRGGWRPAVHVGGGRSAVSEAIQRDVLQRDDRPGVVERGHPYPPDAVADERRGHACGENE